MKTQIRAIGIDDAPFKKGKNENVLVVGVVSRPKLIEGILSTYVKSDGKDATKKILKMIKKSRFFEEIKIIFLNGITLAGLNIIDIKKLSKEIGVPVVCITRKRPNPDELKKALKKANLRVKLPSLEIKKLDGIFLQYYGAEVAKIKKYISLFAYHSKIPEPLRLAHLIASGVLSGESRGKI